VKNVFVIACAALLAGSRLDAHGLDEYVQAARVAVSADALVVHLALTPGVAVAPATDCCRRTRLKSTRARCSAI
jgi:hypothetical protein